ncbi:MAG: orotate phosphoribosyltransferase [uncultured bacterium]|nr:MAG: orotate phosphoribosyltransferase [uncultured bacterium]OGT32699.1 MAG: orotate phosphoribosyltransferase [Gammaproteobacteria bacterium RIFCSPHIGHO2_02_FULL_39_13]OGT48664.1 MAG: orotate phosphoribosyltransferase [Gammaproteobacteria bacterium RIFCSPHIGHO2_12_FULL_39_24]
MSELQTQFIEFLVNNKALQFGEFTLKSGRASPYFFNLGVFDSGKSLAKLGEFYAETLINSRMHCDLLFGPAYKGIPLVTATTIILAEKFNKNIPYCFNRKEKKDYGDVSNFVGAKLEGNMVMLDDVITAGTTVRETVALLENTEATLSGIIIAFDRQERGIGKLSAVQEAVKTHGIPVQSIITLTDVIQYLSAQKNRESQLEAIEQYREQYGK